MSQTATDHAASGAEAMRAEAHALLAAADRLGKDFTNAVDTILARRGKVIVTGLGKSGHVARKIASTLSSTGTSSFYLHPTEALHGDFGMLQEDDTLLAIAFGGETEEVVEVARFARRAGLPVLVITGRKDSTLAKLAHHILDGHVEREADPLNLAPTASSTLAMALGDALAVALMRARGFRVEDFAALHPGGRLGRSLSLVKDHMRSKGDLPTVTLDAHFHAVLEAATARNFGIVAVLDDKGALRGAISDGDIRRALLRLEEKALRAKAQDLMTPNPRTIAANELAIDALRRMNEGGRPITQLFVVSETTGELVGLVRLHDLLAAKIV